MTQYYNSSTHGRIPLSVYAKYLMKTMRDVIVAGIASQNYHDQGEAIAYARGDLAKYISTLEQKITLCVEPCTPGYAAQHLTKGEIEVLWRQLLDLIQKCDLDAVRAVLARYNAQNLAAINANDYRALRSDLLAITADPIAKAVRADVEIVRAKCTGLAPNVVAEHLASVERASAEYHRLMSRP